MASSQKGIREQAAAMRQGLVSRLEALRPTPGTYLTAVCAGATIGEYAARASSGQPDAVLLAVTQLGAQLGVNLLADLIGQGAARPAELSVEQIVQSVQAKMDRGEDLPALRLLLREFDVLRVAFETWSKSSDERFDLLLRELSTHPQMVATAVVDGMRAEFTPHLDEMQTKMDRVLAILEKDERLVVVGTGISLGLRTQKEATAVGVNGVAEKLLVTLDVAASWDRRIAVFADVVGAAPRQDERSMMLTRAMNGVLSDACHLIGDAVVTGASVWVPDVGAPFLKLAHSLGSRQPTLSARRFYIGDDPDLMGSGGLSGRAFKTGTVQLVGDIRTDLHYVAASGPGGEDIPYRSILCAPILGRAATLGVLSIDGNRPDCFDLQVDTRIASQAAAAMARLLAVVSSSAQTGV